MTGASCRVWHLMRRLLFREEDLFGARSELDQHIAMGDASTGLGFREPCAWGYCKGVSISFCSPATLEMQFGDLCVIDQFDPCLAIQCSVRFV